MNCPRCGNLLPDTTAASCSACGWPNDTFRVDGDDPELGLVKVNGVAIGRITEWYGSPRVLRDVPVVEIPEGPFLPGHCQIKTKDGETIVTDLEPVDRFVEAVRTSTREFSDWMSMMKNLDEEQLRVALSILAGEVVSLRRAVDWLYTGKGQEFVKDLQALRAAAAEQGVDLWPELGDDSP